MLDQQTGGRLKIAATYRVSQPIENFVLRIKIVQQKSPLAELFESEGETRDTNYLVTEERDIAWQERIFSFSEKKFYGDENNCVTELQKEYRDIITAGEQNEERDSRLYSFTSKDPYYPDNAKLTKDYVTSLSRRNEMALPIVKNRKPFAKRYNRRVVDEWPDDARIRDNHCLYKDRKSMFILVDLTPKDDQISPSVDIYSPDSRILLCAVTHDRAARTLTIDPDFNANEDDPYVIEAAGLFYDYWIEHASPKPNSDELKRQGEFLQRPDNYSVGHHDPEIHRPQKVTIGCLKRDVAESMETRERRSYRDVEIFREITLPPANVLRLFVNLEIVSAVGFPYDPLFVTYNVDLPRHWKTSETERLTGRTQRSRMVNSEAHFGYVNEIPLDFDLNSLNSTDVQPSWPQLIFSIGSIDSWTRYRIEGYATAPLPATSGARSFLLPTWRPIGGFVDVLRRFFTGGTSELEDVTYCGIPEHPGTRKLDKARLKVAPAGSVGINLNIVRQSKIFMKNRGGGREESDKTSADTLINSLDNVLEQFKAARERMIRAKAQ